MNVEITGQPRKLSQEALDGGKHGAGPGRAGAGEATPPTSGAGVESIRQMGNLQLGGESRAASTD